MSKTLGTPITRFAPFLNKYINPVKMNYSTISVFFFEKILELLKDGMTEWQTVTVKYEKLDHIPKGQHFSQNITEVVDIINHASSVFTAYRATFKIGNQTYSGHFVYFIREIDQPKLYDEVYKNTQKLFLWLYIANSFSTRSHKGHPHLNIYVYMTDLLKQLPLYPMVIDEVHVNTGFTIPCTKTSKREINIFRREEWYKVFIHETFHNLCLDFCDSDKYTKQASDHILSIIPLNIDLRLYETYCEIWAEIMNIAISAFLVGGHSFVNWFRRVKQMIEMERRFSVFQCAKILNYHGLQIHNLFLNDVESLHRRKKYRENTCVFSYYVLKSVLMYYIDDFIICCMKNNRGSIEFRIHQSVIQSYCDFIKEHFVKRDFVEIIEDIQDFIMNMKPKNQYRDIMTSLRMTING